MSSNYYYSALKQSTPPFLNQYSYNFDGINDVIREEALSFIPPPVISISVWVKTDFTTGGDTTNIGYIVSKDNGSAGRDFYVIYRGTGTNKLFFGFWSPGGTNSSVASPTFPLGNPTDGNWHHILATWDGTTDANKIQLFVDGSLIAQATANDTGIRNSTTTNLTIGGPDTTTNTRLFYGNIDEVAIFNTDQSANVAEIYNGGVPKDLTDLSPMTWYRMGENATWRDPQWLIPSNENKDKVSNYSMDFDGVSDYIDCGDSNETEGITTLSISGWFKPNSGGVGGASGIVAKESRDFYVGWYSAPTNSIRFWISDDDGVTNDNVNSLTLGTNANVLNKWHHFVCTWNAVDKLKIYINGVLSNETNSVNANSALPSSTNILEIGRRVSTYFNGNIDNVSLYNSELSQSDVTNIYNGGTPTTITGAVAHYRMGEDATFDGTNWTVPDNAGSNDGTSANMTLSDRLGDAPNSINNVLSLNMVEVDRETDVPT